MTNTKHQQIAARRRASQGGFTIIAYAVMLLVILGFTGMAVDVGYLQWQKRMAQAAADAAAMGALREIELGNTDLVDAGRNDAALNGFVNGQNGVTVTINNPPSSGPFAGQTGAVEAIVRRTYPTFFMMVLGTNSVSLAARAIAQTASTTTYTSGSGGTSGGTASMETAGSSSGSIGGCIFALNPHTSSALSINGTSMKLNTSCSAIVESDDNSAFSMGSGVTFNLVNRNAHVGVVGGWHISGQAQVMDASTTPAVAENPITISSPGDPLAKVPEPVRSNVNSSNATQSASSVSYSKTSMPPGNVLNPGIYCGGITVSDTDNHAITMNPGVYIMAGGGFKLNSNAVIAGTGVMIYNTSGGWGCSSSTGFAPLNIDGQATVTLSAATSGTWVGILFFQDRNVVSSNNNQIVGGSGSSFDGALYFKYSPLKFAGTNATNGYMVLVADTISINGNTILGNNYTSLSEPNPFAPLATGGGLVQ